MKTREALKILRKKGFEGKKLMEITDFSSGHISKIETGMINPEASFELIKRICKETGIPIEKIDDVVKKQTN